MLKIRKYVKFNISLVEDEDLQYWLNENKKEKYEVVEVDKKSQLFWIKDCEYAISFNENFVEEV